MGADFEFQDDEQKAAVEAFFNEEPENESADALSGGEQAIAEALEQGEETEEVEEESDDADEPSEEPDGDDGSDEPDDATDDDGDGDDEEEELHPAEAARRRAQAESDRKIAALEQQLQQLQQYAQQVYAQQMQAYQAQQAQTQQAQQANPYAGLTKDHVVNAVESDLVGTFQVVAQYRPDLVAPTIASAREKYGHEIGDQMQLEYNQYLLAQERAEREAYAEQQAQARASEEAPAQMQQMMVGLIENISSQYGDAFKEIEADFIARAQETAPAFKEYMENQGLEMTPDALHYFLTKCVNDVREERIASQASKPRKPRKVAPEQHVENSTNNQGNRPEDMTEDERAISELLEGARELAIDISSPDR